MNLDVLSIVRLSVVLFSLVIASYLLGSPRKSPATLFLAGAFLGAMLFNAASFFEFAGQYYWQPRTIRTVLVELFYDLGPSLAMIFLLLFTYHFPRFRREERTEFRTVIVLSVILNTAVLGLNVCNHFILQWQFSDMRLWDVYWLVLYSSLAVQFLGAIVLLFRKAARLSGHGARPLLARILRPSGPDALAVRALGTILLLPVAAVGASFAMTLGAIPVTVGNYLTWVGLLLFYLGFIITYLNHTRDPMTLQAKLIGVTLVLILGTMGVVAVLVGQTAASDYPRASLLPERSTIRFTLNGSRGYDIRRVTSAFDPELGQKMDAAYGSSLIVPMPFDFPFFAGRYRVVHVLNGPMVYLGETVRENGWGGYNPQPAVAPIIMNLDPSRGGGIHVKSAPRSMTITWFRLPELGTNDPNTVQLVLRSDGAIEMSFLELNPSSPPSIEQLYNYTAASTTGGDPAPGGRPAPFPPRLTGIHPGGREAPLVPISFSRDLPWSGEGPAVIFESHEAGFARHLNGRMGFLAVLTVAACLAALLLIPLLLRTSLFGPVRALSAGMRQVESGDLGAVLRVTSSDEIGSLSRSFNRMVESIRRVESSFRALAEDSHDGIIVFAGETAVYANRRASEMTGYPASSLARTRFEAFFSSAVLPAYGITPDAPCEALLAAAEGPSLPVELVYSDTRWHGMPAIAVVVRDITQRKREEETAHRQQQNLMRMDKLSSLGVLAAGLAHEINVPNQVILSNASLLARAAPELGRALASALDDSRGSLLAGLEVSEFLERFPGVLSAITTSAALIDGIIHGLRDFSAESSVTGTSPFDINEAIRGAVHLVDAYIRRATDRFSMDVEPDLPRVRGSSQRMQQVFINLILNSCQSLDGRSRAVVVSSCLDTSRSFVRVTVHDEGVGIAPEDLPHVKEQFFTTRAAVGGTGLGLYVSQQIITDHGGTLELHSTPRVGTDAVITLPVEVQP